MYEKGKPVNFPGTLVAYKPKEAPMEVKSEAGEPHGEGHKRRMRARDGKLLPRSAPLDLDQKILRMLTYKRS
jgi:hypothetical protein